MQSLWGGISVFAEGQPSLLGIDRPPRVDSKVQLHREPCLAATDSLHGEGEDGARLAGHGLQQRAAQRGGREQAALAEGTHVLRATGVELAGLEQLAHLVRVRVRVGVGVGGRGRVRVRARARVRVGPRLTWSL